MYFLDKRIQVICNELKKLSVKQKLAVKELYYKPGFFLRSEEADKSTTKYESFDSQNMHWYGPDKHYWFKADIQVPQSFDKKPLWIYISTQIDEYNDMTNPQFLAFINDKAVQGADMNHRKIFLTDSAKAGEKFCLGLQAYTGTLHTEFSLKLQLLEIEPEIEALYWDLQVPLSAFSRMDKESQSRLKIEQVLNDAVNLIDLREPYSEGFYRTVRQAREYLKKHLYEELGGNTDVIATCIGQTHIDVAWWWTVEQTREKVARSFATVLKLMDEYPNYRFMSSQPQLYVFLKERYPELYQELKNRIKEGRWEAEGGMWVEADCNLTSGESLIRQFVYGKRFFKEEFNVDSKILWLPDVFGYPGSLPQIMKVCGIDYFMTTKLSWNQFNKHPYDTFMWRGIDGSEILTHLVTTLGIGQQLDNFYTTYNGNLHPDAIIGGWERYQNKDINNDVLICYGFGDGGGGPTRAMLENSKRLEHGVKGIPKVRQAFAKTYFDEIKDRLLDNPRLPKWEGELYFEYHRGTYTSMARNKRSNRKTEFALMDTELLSVLAQDKLDYPKNKLDDIWTLTLCNQFHDILPGSCIHEVYEVTKKEYAQMAEELTALQNERLSALFPEQGNSITVVNTKGFNANETVKLHSTDALSLKDENGTLYPLQHTADGAEAYLSDIPAKGWRSYTLSSEKAEENIPFVLSDNYHLETPFYSVEFDEQGLISRLYDKENDREVLKAGTQGNLFKMYEDKPIYYDNWDIDIYYTEKSWPATALDKFEWSDIGEVSATLYVERKISKSIIKQKIKFYANERRIDFDTYVDWKQSQHLLKVHFPVNILSDEASFDIQFGNITRKVHTNTSWDIARFESCGQKWVDMSEGHYGVSILNDCKYGHSIKDGNIALTLIKSGIEPNPVTDQEEHYFTYSLYPHAGALIEGGTIKEAYCLNQPSLFVKGAGLQREFSLCNVSKPNVMVETIKKAEDGNGIIVRMYETDKALTKAEFTWKRPVTQVIECNAIEEKIKEIPLNNNSFAFEIKPFEIKTFRIIEKE
ncbi:MAG: alpha-mannosidase [Eubacteriales bacterium]|nr:alpha-mannosidase [Eubacteriales bacterium]